MKRTHSGQFEHNLLSCLYFFCCWLLFVTFSCFHRLALVPSKHFASTIFSFFLSIECHSNFFPHLQNASYRLLHEDLQPIEKDLTIHSCLCNKSLTPLVPRCCQVTRVGVTSLTDAWNRTTDATVFIIISNVIWFYFPESDQSRIRPSI